MFAIVTPDAVSESGGQGVRTICLETTTSSFRDFNRLQAPAQGFNDVRSGRTLLKDVVWAFGSGGKTLPSSAVGADHWVPKVFWRGPTEVAAERTCPPSC